jgi:glycosyltransferase involved in cell wall biosynthesis
MYKNKTVAIVIPCYGEETQIRNVIETMPDFVDKMYVIDDQSKDKTFEVIEDCAKTNSKVVPILHKKNGGVGKAISTGYIRARDEGIDITVVMAGDGQMDPDDLESVVDPVAEDLVDYCKGNRFLYRDGVKKIPRTRFFGNFVLSAMTKIISGYWHVSDSQTGYTAISLMALKNIDVENIFPRYGCPNDILVKLNIEDMRVGEVPVNPLYGVGEQSKMKIPKVIGPILKLMSRLFIERMVHKYIIRTGHPVVLAYAFPCFVLSVLPQKFFLREIFTAYALCLLISIGFPQFYHEVGTQFFE